MHVCAYECNYACMNISTCSPSPHFLSSIFSAPHISFLLSSLPRTHSLSSLPLRHYFCSLPSLSPLLLQIHVILYLSFLPLSLRQAAARSNGAQRCSVGLMDLYFGCEIPDWHCDFCVFLCFFSCLFCLFVCPLTSLFICLPYMFYFFSSFFCLPFNFLSAITVRFCVLQVGRYRAFGHPVQTV